MSILTTTRRVTSQNPTRLTIDEAGFQVGWTAIGIRGPIIQFAASQDIPVRSFQSRASDDDDCGFRAGGIHSAVCNRCLDAVHGLFSQSQKPGHSVLEWPHHASRTSTAINTRSHGSWSSSVKKTRGPYLVTKRYTRAHLPDVFF